MHLLFLNLYNIRLVPKFLILSWNLQSQEIYLNYVLIIFCLFLPFGLQAQFVPSQYSNVKENENYTFTLMRDEPFGIYIGATVLWTSNSTLHSLRLFLNDQEIYSHRSSNGDTGSGRETGSVARLVEGPLKAGQKIYLKGIVEAPGDLTARLFSLSTQAVSYDTTVNLADLEQKINNLEAAVRNRIHQNTDRISDVTNQLVDVKNALNDLRQRLDGFGLDYSQFKTETNLRLDSLDTRVASLESNLQNVSQQLHAHLVASDQFEAQILSRFNAMDRTVSDLGTKLEDHYKTLKDQDAKILNACRAEGNQLKTQVASRFDSVDREVSGLNSKIFALENHSRAIRDRDAALLENRFATLKKQQQSSSRCRPNNLLGIIGASAGGASILLAGGAFYQLQKNEEQRRMSLKQSKNGIASEWRDFKDFHLKKIPSRSKSAPKEFK